jgi:hypothetical protein
VLRKVNETKRNGSISVLGKTDFIICNSYQILFEWFKSECEMDRSCSIHGREENITVGRRSFGRPINWSGNLLVDK